MTLLISGLIIFIGVHSLPGVTGARGHLVARLGELPYKGLFSLVSLIGFGLIIAGMMQPAHESLWQAPVWARQIPQLVMPLVFVLLASAYLPSRIRHLTPHPMLWGVILWAMAHLPVNSTWEDILLFGSFGIFSFLGILSLNKRGKIKVLRNANWKNDSLVAAIGLTAYLLCLHIHP